MKIILITGKQGSGKSTLSKNLTKTMSYTNKVFNMKFADPLYKMHDAALEVARAYGIPTEIKEGVLLQLLGTEWGRKVKGENVWVDSMKSRIEMNTRNSQNSIVIIDDCRFENEFNAFPDAFRIRLTAPESARSTRAESWRPNTQHPSETGLDHIMDSEFDAVINTAEVNEENTLKIVLDLLYEKK